MVESEIEDKELLEKLKEEFTTAFKFFTTSEFINVASEILHQPIDVLKKSGFTNVFKSIVDARRKIVMDTEPYIQVKIDRTKELNEGKAILIPIESIIGSGNSNIKNAGEAASNERDAYFLKNSLRVVESLKGSSVESLEYVITDIFKLDHTAADMKIRLGKLAGLDDVYFIIDGHHRVNFATVFEVRHIPAVIYEVELENLGMNQASAENSLQKNKFDKSNKKATIERFINFRR